jgi:hypothetical protein
LTNILSKFSEETDGLIDTLKNKWIQIRTESRNEEGLFDFDITKSPLYEPQMRLTPTTTYEEFVDMLIAYLWQMTDTSLENIRSEISTTLKEKFNQAYDSLLKSIIEFPSGIRFPLLESSIAKSRIVIQDELDKIAWWFTRSQPSETRDFDIELPLRIGINMVNNAYPTKQLNPEIEISEKCTLKGNALKSIVDIVYILLDNIVKHSGINERVPSVKISFKKEAENLNLQVENEIPHGIDLQAENIRLQKIRESLAKEASMEIVRKEGGTGFYKIQKILRFDICCNHVITFFFTNSKFVALIKIEGKQILV